MKFPKTRVLVIFSGLIFLLAQLLLIPQLKTKVQALSSGDGLSVVYYSNPNFTGSQIQRVDSRINFNWNAAAPDPAIQNTTFSVRWTGQLLPKFSENYTFYTRSDDGIRLWVNNQLVIDNWTDHPPVIDQGSVLLAENQKVNIKMEYYQKYGEAIAKLSWSSPSTPKQVVPQSQLFSDASNTDVPIITPTKTINQPTPTPTPPPASQNPAPSGNMINSFVTYYGWIDNSPSGTDIAFPGFPGTIHTEAGGTGTYSDPITMATDPEVFPAGTRMYVPYIKKYVITEDICGGCANDPSVGKYHIDIWMNSDSRNSNQLISCENAWTISSTEVEVNPPDGRLVDTTPLFDPSTGSCLPQ